MRYQENGNILFIILIAIALFAALSFTVTNVNRGGGAGVSKEQLNIEATDALAYATRMKSAIDILYGRNGISEADLNFSHPDAPSEYGDPFDTGANPIENQIFATEGGGITYETPNPLIRSNPNDTSGWEFLATSRAPEVGFDDTTDLLAVIPNVSEDFCESINILLGYTPGTIPSDTSPECVYESGSITSDRFTGTFTANGSANDMGSSNYTAQNFRLPAPAACVECGTSEEYHFYYTLLER